MKASGTYLATEVNLPEVLKFNIEHPYIARTNKLAVAEKSFICIP
jgi:hypothetical protein